MRLRCHHHVSEAGSHTFAWMLPAVLLIACSSVDDPGAPEPPATPGTTVPASWAGSYLISLTDDRGRAGRPTTEYDVVLFCPGKSFDEVFDAARFDAGTGLPFEDISCSGIWSSSSADITCMSTLVVGGCAHTQTLRFVVSRTGDTLAGTLSATHDFAPVPGGSGPCEEGSTSSVTIAGERTDTDTPGCADLEEVIPASWEGEWEITVSAGVPCEDPPSPVTYTNPTPLCPGEDVVASLFDLDENDGVETRGGMNDARIDLFFTFRPAAECDVIRAFRLYATRSGDGFSGSWAQIDYTVGGGEACAAEIACTSGTCDGVRTGASGCP